MCCSSCNGRPSVVVNVAVLSSSDVFCTALCSSADKSGCMQVRKQTLGPACHPRHHVNTGLTLVLLLMLISSVSMPGPCRM